MRLLDQLARSASTESLDEHGSSRAVATTLLAIAAIACTVALLDGAPATALVASATTSTR
jgi:hypothetical protein